MIINNSEKKQIKILIDIEDLKNSEINLNEWICSPEKHFKKLIKNIPIFKNISTNKIYVYSYKFILFYIFIKY